MTNAKIAPTPLPTRYNPIENTESVNPVRLQKYQQIIGSLLYLMLGTQPDIAYAVIKLLQFSANPSQIHLDKAMYIMHYLVGTQNYRIVYNGRVTEGLMAFTDSNWAADETKCRSMTGYFTVLASSSVCWQSRLQKTVALLSTKAKYMALSDTSRQIVWIQSLFNELKYQLRQIPVCADNPSLLDLIQFKKEEPNILIFTIITYANALKKAKSPSSSSQDQKILQICLLRTLERINS